MKQDLLMTVERALMEYFEAIPRQKEQNPPDLMPILQKLIQLQKDYQGEMEPELRHFMQRQSYEKALHRVRELK